MIILPDISGQKFGRLTVLTKAQNKNGRTRYLCLCQCGNLKEISTRNLLNGYTKSCGCLKKENPIFAKKHGEKGTPLYIIWKSMRQRCNNKNHKYAKNYCNKGIKICEEWNDFKTFKKWAFENGYKESKKTVPFKYHLSIDRINPNGDYCPQNCRWITVSENSKRINHSKKERGDHHHEVYQGNH